MPSGRKRRATAFALTPREQAIVWLRGEGLTRRQIAERLGLTLKAVETRITTIRHKQETDA